MFKWFRKKRKCKHDWYHDSITIMHGQYNRYIVRLCLKCAKREILLDIGSVNAVLSGKVEFPSKLQINSYFWNEHFDTEEGCFIHPPPCQIFISGRRATKEQEFTEMFNCWRYPYSFVSELLEKLETLKVKHDERIDRARFLSQALDEVDNIRG